MSLAILTYLLLTLQSLAIWLTVGVIAYIAILAFVFIFTSIIWADGCQEQPFVEYIKSSLFYFILKPKLLILTILVVSAIPSDSTIKWVLGAYVAQESVTFLSNSEEYTKLPENVAKAANAFLEQYTTKEGDTK